MSDTAIKDGYKKTKIGWIPEEWELIKFEEILSDEKTPLSYGILQPGTGVDNGIPMLRTVDLTETGFADTTILKVPESLSNQYSKTILRGGEILMSVMGTLGRTIIVPLRCAGWNVNRALAVVRTNELIENSYLCIYLRSELFKRLIAAKSMGSAQLRINLTDLRKYPVTLPIKKEQKKIAQILTTWDTAIEKTEQLLQQLQLRKKGLMQQLLSGKKRVKGFVEEWKEVKLGEVGKSKIGLTYSPKDVVDEGGVLVLRSSNIQNDSLSLKDNVFVNCKISKKNIVEEGDILICARNGSRRLIGKNIMITKKSEGMAFGAFMSVYQSEYNGFLKHAFKSALFYKQVYRNLGATINQITSKNILAFKFLIPSKEEQKAIEKILNQSDLEIEKTKTHLAHLQIQKKGLMQQLLTGQKRVNIN